MKHAALRRYFRHGTLTQLSVFEAVARHGSFTRAGEELHLAQPTVSVQMKKLAESLGVKLFAQCGRRIELTEAGHELNLGVQELFGQLGELERRLVDLRHSDVQVSSEPALRLAKVQ